MLNNKLQKNSKIFLILVTLGLISCSEPGAENAQTSEHQTCGTSLEIETADEIKLEQWSETIDIENAEAFANVLQYVNQHGTLPPCYLSKTAARAQGWAPGENLWATSPGKAIGGDHFGNYERLLPKQYKGRYVEADLDFKGGKRGAKRLVFVKGIQSFWLLWVTTDHYKNFYRVRVK